MAATQFPVKPFLTKAVHSILQNVQPGAMMSELINELLDGLKSGVQLIQAIAPGLSPEKIVDDVAQEGKRLLTHGAMEGASAMFNGSAFVLYGPGQYVPSSSQSQELTVHGAQKESQEHAPQEQEMSRGR
jgi:hypothetical protein